VRRGRVPAPRGRPRSFPVSVAWSASFPPHHRCGAQLRGRLDLSQRYSCPAHPWSIRLGRESKLAAQAEGLFCFSLHSRLGLPITRGFSQIAPQKSEPLRGGGADRGRHLFQNGAHPSSKPPVLRRQVRSLGSSSRAYGASKTARLTRCCRRLILLLGYQREAIGRWDARESIRPKARPAAPPTPAAARTAEP
jgi:hypothetical protein